jgi:antitoxin VapB
MPLSIKDSETDRLARQLASQTGETITDALKKALSERLAREKRKRTRAGLSRRLLEIGQRCALHMDKSARSLDHDDLLYDEKGLPR